MMSRTLLPALVLLTLACGPDATEPGMMTPPGCPGGISWPSFPVPLRASSSEWMPTARALALFWETSVGRDLFEDPVLVPLFSVNNGVNLWHDTRTDPNARLAFFGPPPVYDSLCNIREAAVIVPLAVRAEDEGAAGCALVRLFGRALGLADDVDPKSVMSPCGETISSDRRVTEHDAELLRE